MKISNENLIELIYAYDDNSNLLDISFCDELYGDKIYYNYDNKTEIFYTILNKTKEELILDLFISLRLYSFDNLFIILFSNLLINAVVCI